MELLYTRTTNKKEKFDLKSFKILKYLLNTAGFPQTIILIITEMLRRTASFETVSILQFDLTKNFEIPTPSMPLLIRELDNKDVNLILQLNEPGINLNELRARIERFLLIKAQIPTCYVAANLDDEPCAICWLIDHTSNEILKSHYNGGIFELKDKEILCEGIYVHSAFRNKKLMQYLTFKIFEKAFKNGAQKAFAFVDNKNSLSLKGSKSIGWEKVGVKEVRWILFNRSITYKMHIP